MKQTYIIGIAALVSLVGIGVIYYALIRLHGITITSWWRTFWRNTEVGGVKSSLHMVGLAWDCIPVTRENEEYLRSLGLTVINEKDHLHAQV